MAASANSPMIYSVSRHHSTHHGALIDCGANGGIGGSDVRIISHNDHSVDVHGIDDNQITDILIVTCGAVAKTQHGEVIVIMHQYAYTGNGKMIYSSVQLEWCKNDVNCKSIKVVSGLQCISTNDGFVYPLNIHDVLPYISICPYSDHEWDTLPHVVWSSNTDWDPTVLDYLFDNNGRRFDALQEVEQGPTTNLFHKFSKYCKRVLVQNSEQYHDILPRPFFGFLPTDIANSTFKATTQFA
jgi:hypothetical protein